MDIRQNQFGVLVTLTLIIPVVSTIFQLPVERITSDQQTVKSVYSRRDQSTLQLDSEGRKINLTRFERPYYVTKIYVGSRRTEMKMLLDTGTSDLWFPSASCGECDFYCYGIPEIYARSLCKEGCWTIFNNFNGSACIHKRTFNAAQSTSYKEDKGAWYQSLYEVGGFRGIDVIDAGGMVFNTSIGQVTSQMPTGSEFDGVFGLGFPYGSVLKRPPPLLAAVEQKLIDKAMFTVFLKKSSTGMNEEDRGVITFGGTDTDNCDSNVDYVPLSSEIAFQFEMQKLKVGQKTIVDSPKTVLMDIGSSYTFVPEEIFSAIADALGAEKIYSDYMVDCNKKLDNITIMAGGLEFVLTKDAFVEEIWWGFCMLSIRGTNSEDRHDWVLGLPFMHQFCITYDLDNKQIGIAKPIKN